MRAVLLPTPQGVEPDGVAHPHGSAGSLWAGPARCTLGAASLGFFGVPLDAVVVNVALRSIRTDLGGSIAGLEWVVDGSPLMSAALLLWWGSLAARVGARRAFAAGLALFV